MLLCNCPGDVQGASGTKFIVDILANCVTVDGEGRNKVVRPVPLDDNGEPAVVGIPLNQVCASLLVLFMCSVYERWGFFETWFKQTLLVLHPLLVGCETWNQFEMSSKSKVCP